CELVHGARAMEGRRPPAGRTEEDEGQGPRAVTEFNHFFQSAYQAVVECVVRSAESWPEANQGDDQLAEALQRLTGPFLALWFEHSQTLQLSVLEGVRDDEWRGVAAFVETYGRDLFHAR